MAKIRSTKLHAQFAKAKEAMKEYDEAVLAYERAQVRVGTVWGCCGIYIFWDVENFERLHLEL